MDRDPDGDPVCRMAIDARLRRPSGGDLFYRALVAVGFARKRPGQPAKETYLPTPDEIRAACEEIRRNRSVEDWELAKQRG